MNLPDKDQYLNIITLLQEVLKFYGKEENYIEDQFTGTDAYSLIEIDKGSQARDALKRVEDFVKQHEEMETDYEKFFDELTNKEGVEPIIFNKEEILRQIKGLKESGD